MVCMANCMHTVHLELATQYSHAAGCSVNMMMERVRNNAIVANFKIGTGMIILGCSTRVV